MPHTHATTHSTQSSHDHGDPLKAYLGVFVALLILLFATVGAYWLDFGAMLGDKYQFLNTAVALTIATIKSLLVILVFMHIRHSTRLVWVVAASGFVWLSIMILFTFTDYLSRETVDNYATQNHAAMTSSYEQDSHPKGVDTTKTW